MTTITKPFEWIEHEGKRYANQKQFASLLGIRTQNLKRWLLQRKISVLNLITLDKLNQTLYPYEIVCTAILTMEVKSDLGLQLKRSLLSQLTQTQLPKQEPLQLAPPKASRDKLREIVANIANEMDIPYMDVWHKLWLELYYRCHVNVKQRAQNAGKRPLDVIVELGYCDISISILKEVFA